MPANLILSQICKKEEICKASFIYSSHLFFINGPIKLIFKFNLSGLTRKGFLNEFIVHDKFRPSLSSSS